MVTIGFPGSSYLIGVSFPDNRSDKVPTTWTLGLVFVFLLDFLMHNSFMVFAYIGISCIAWRNGIFIYRFCNSPRMSKSGGCIGRDMTNRSGKGGEDVLACLLFCSLFSSFCCGGCSIGN